MNTSYCEWNDEYWDTLIPSIQEKNCILLLGPDAATQKVNGQQQPLTEILANQLSEELEPKIKEHINISDLAQVSQYYSMEQGKQDLIDKVKSFYKERENLTTELHRNLAALPFYFTITTTPDNMFPIALRDEKKEPDIGWYDFSKKKQETVTLGPNGKPLVFYLYGNIKERKSLLLAENDFMDFMMSLISKDPSLQDNIRSELRDENKSFLSFGFGFKYWYKRFLLHVLQGRSKKNFSFAVEKFTTESITEIERTVFFFKKSNYKIYIFKQDFYRFAEELRKRFEQYSPESISQAKAAKAPEVFICHAWEDKEYADSLYERFEVAGLRPWLDKENLRGGVKWKNEIEKIINQVDYFIVLQSKALQERIRGFVFREIRIALDCQDDFRPGLCFIIPVKIDDCSLLEDLNHLHTIDLTDEANFKELVSTIKRDFEKRNKQ